tara:strand:- start:617 stop:850 length:234 start_codon:yes stop_codon:yes gene_type:complete
MSYKSNPQHLPPSRSAEEYEREIIRLKLQLREAETTIRKAAASTWDEWSDPAHVIASSYFSRKTDLDLMVEDIKKDE